MNRQRVEGPPLDRAHAGMGRFQIDREAMAPELSVLSLEHRVVPALDGCRQALRVDAGLPRERLERLGAHQPVRVRRSR